MEKVTKPTVSLLTKGEKFQAKQMEAKPGDHLPKHFATIESVLIILEGEYILNLNGTDHHLHRGESFIVPPKIEHQIRAIIDFKAAHVMTNDIEFQFFK